MATNAGTVSMAAGMICKAAVLAARWAGTKRKRALEEIAALPGEEKDKGILLLRELVKQLQDQLSFYLKQFGKGSKKPRSGFKTPDRVFRAGRVQMQGATTTE